MLRHVGVVIIAIQVPIEIKTRQAHERAEFWLFEYAGHIVSDV
jgi:hypothetical protein